MTIIDVLHLIATHRGGECPEKGVGNGGEKLTLQTGECS